MLSNAAKRLTNYRSSWHSKCHYSSRQSVLERNRDVNAFVHISPPPASISHQDAPLSDLTVAIKDNIATVDAPTTCSSAILENFRSPFDATVVKLLRDTGADLVGKTNCDEFGMGSLNIYSIHGPVINPFKQRYRERRSAGGSSGGSAAAVAAGMCDAALGTDTGGSIRLPASYCGVSGLKPSYGLISRLGVVSFADSLDCVGVLAKDVNTTKRVFDKISAYDPHDPTSAYPETRQLATRLSQRKLDQLHASLETTSFNGLRIGIPQEYFPTELSDLVKERFANLLATLKSRGAELIPVSLPATSYALSSYYVIASAEASSNMARYDGIQYGKRKASTLGVDIKQVSNTYAQTRSEGFGSEVQKRILLGTYALTADAFDNYFLQAQKVRQLVKNDFNRAFQIKNVSLVPPEELSLDQHDSLNADGVDVLIHPSAIRTAPFISFAQEGLDSYVQDVLTVPASLAGLPALSVPCPINPSNPEGDDWPIGVSIVGQWGTDELVLSIGKAIESL